jgi:hypothetical protein
MEHQILTQEQALARIHQFYQDGFRHLISSWLRPNEHLFWAGNHSAYWGEPLSQLGYLVITTYRVLCVNFEVSFGMFSGRRKIKYQDQYVAIDLPSKPLTSKEKDSKEVREVSLRNIPGIERHDFEMGGTTYVQLWIKLEPEGVILATLYSLQDGQEAYNILQDAIRNGGLETRSNSDIADQLAKLAKLFQDKAITKEEYEAAKAKLLA